MTSPSPAGPSEAKAVARERLRGIWAATLTPFAAGSPNSGSPDSDSPDSGSPDSGSPERGQPALDLDGWRRNLRHWYGELGIAGLFVNGKQGEFASMTVDERKATAEAAVEEARPYGAGVMISVSDQHIEVAAELTRHAEAIGADFVVAHTPLLYFGAHTDDTLLAYYRHLAGQVTGTMGVVLWNQPPDCGYLLRPDLCVRLAREIPNVVAIKYSVPRGTYTELTHLAGDDLIVSTSSEADWLDNIAELGWQVYLCSTPPFLLQTANDRRMHHYTEAALAGNLTEARAISASLEPVRRALADSRPPGRAAAHQKYWQELLGQVGGPVRRPYLELTDAEKAATRLAFERCGLVP